MARTLLGIFGLVLVLTASICAQRVALIAPESEGELGAFDAQLRTDLGKSFRVLDDSLSFAAFRSAEIATPFNQTSDEARRLASVIGCEYLVVLRSAVQRREAIARAAYFEAYTFAFVVDGRSGWLINFVLESREGPDAASAQNALVSSSAQFSETVEQAIRRHNRLGPKDAKFAEVPPDGSPQSKGLRTPVPYKRIRPEYTREAYLYGIEATVDIEVDIDERGEIARTSIERWAGFGLDESVEKTVRSMNWRPAERDGKPLPMRILLRYNFTKIEKDEAP